MYSFIIPQQKLHKKCLDCKNKKYNKTFKEWECAKGNTIPQIAFSCYEKKY